jgi:2-oxo-3-hexenedioate decarboxylase
MIAEAARALDEAQRTGRPIRQLSADVTVSVTDAYAIQMAAFERRLARGEREAGVKLGFTSRAKMQQMGISDIIAGRLTEQMRADEGGEIDLDALIHPRIEPEIAYLLGADLDPDDPDLRPGTIAAVAPALEIIDSRYRDFRFSLEDVIADNASSARYVIGDWTAPGTDVGNRAVTLEICGRLTETGSTAAILGDPSRALRRLARMSAAARIRLRAGQVVLAGAATAAVPFPPGPVLATVTGLGRVAIRGVSHG